MPQHSISADLLIPDLLREYPQARAVLDRYGLHGCGGPLGPPETLRFFAQAHNVDVDVLLEHIDDAIAEPPAPSSAAPDAAQSAAQIIGDVLYRRFFKAAIVIAMGIGFLTGVHMLVQAMFGKSFVAYSSSLVAGHAHAQIFGWVGLFVLGFAYQAFPRHAHTTLYRPGLANATFFLMLAGIGHSVWAQFVPPSTTSAFMASAGGLLEITAIGMGAYLIVQTLRHGEAAWDATERYAITALVLLLAATIMEAVYLTGRASPTGTILSGTANIPKGAVRALELHGFVLIMLLGVGARVLPKIFGFRPANPTLLRALLPVFALAALAETAGYLSPLLGLPMTTARGLIIASQSVMAVAALAVISGFAPWRAVEFPERSVKFIRAALACGVVALVLAPVLLAGPKIPALYALNDAVRHVFVIGFVTMMIVGVGGRIVPTLEGVDTRALTNMWLPFGLLLGGVLLRVTGALATGYSDIGYALVGISGLAVFTGVGIWALMLWQIMGLDDEEKLELLQAAQELAKASRPPAPEASPSSQAHAHAEPLAPPQTPGKPAPPASPIDISLRHTPAQVLDAFPDAMGIFVRLGFTAIQNPAIRNGPAQVVTLETVTQHHNIDPMELLNALHTELALQATSGLGAASPHDPIPQIITGDMIIADINRTYPVAMTVFKKYGLDSCCGAEVSLAYAAPRHDFVLEDIIADLNAAIATATRNT